MKDIISVLIPESELKKRIAELGQQITGDFQGESVHLICILKGSVFFTCELAQHIHVPLTMDFMRVASYGDDTTSSDIVRLSKDLDDSIEGKNVVVVEDIVDTGRTLSYLLKLFEQRKPKTLKLCTLLSKPARRVTEIEGDYTGFEIPDKFVVGFGLDFAEHYRNLPYIGVIEELGDERE